LGAASLAFEAATFATGAELGAWAASEVAHNMLTPSVNIKQTRSPENRTGAAPINNRVTGHSLCMKNTALCDLIAASESL
jgi:hypothetical protein